MDANASAATPTEKRTLQVMPVTQALRGRARRSWPATVRRVVVVRARGVGKSVGRGAGSRRLLSGLDLDVAAGEMVAVLGRSGSGKSTLLHLLGGLDRADQGRIEVGGEPLTGASERE